MEFQRESKEHIREQVKSLRDRVIQSHQQLREARLEHEQAKKEHDENVQALGQALAQLKTCQEILLRANTDFIEKNRAELLTPEEIEEEARRLNMKLAIAEKEFKEAECQLAIDRDVMQYLDRRLEDLEGCVMEYRTCRESKTTQIEADQNMKEYLASEWEEIEQKCADLQEQIALLNSEKEDALARFEAADNVRNFLGDRAGTLLF